MWRSCSTIRAPCIQAARAISKLKCPRTGATNCPVAMARLASRTMLNNLFPAGGPATTQIGLVRFRGCFATQRYNPVPDEAATRGCVLFSEEHALAGPAGKASLNSTIDTESAVGGFPGTNICTGLDQGSSVLFGSGSQIGAKKVIVLITDGDNRYSDGAEGGNRTAATRSRACCPRAPGPAARGVPTFASQAWFPATAVPTVQTTTPQSTRWTR